MPRFICVHSHAFTEEELIGLAQRRGDIPAGLTWRGSWTTTESIGYCEWEGPDAQAVRNVLEANQIPLEAIHEVRYFDPDAGAFVA
jgi:hypothetical protein